MGEFLARKEVARKGIARKGIAGAASPSRAKS
jgi:hypothetical protein